MYSSLLYSTTVREQHSLEESVITICSTVISEWNHIKHKHVSNSQIWISFFFLQADSVHMVSHLMTVLPPAACLNNNKLN